MPKAVRINKAGQVVALDNPVKVSRKEKDDVLWVALEGGGPWTITFDKINDGGPSKYPIKAGSPFGQSTYTTGNGGSGGSTGGPVGDERYTYRYNVRDANGRVTDDPDVDVDP